VLLGLALFALYVVVRALESPARRAAAEHHGRDLLAVERHLHIDLERWLNHGLAPHHVLSTLADYEYAWTYILSALALLTWVWVRRPDLWRPTRDSFVVLNLIAIATFALYPTAPPRMLADEGFVDTVRRGATVGSWGSGLVDTANQLAAMPSLHIGWALWVSAVLARITARRSVQVLSAVHVLLTAYVVMATANHYLLDALAAVVAVALGIRYAAWRYDAPAAAGEVVPSCDAFFLHVEDTGAPQHVGGLAVFAPSATGRDEPSLEDIRELARTELVPRGRFHQRLAPATRWRRPRWVDVDVDLDWHVQEVRAPDGPDGHLGVVSGLAEEPLSRDRPLWRIVLVRELAPGRSGLVLLVHHAMADGIGTVAHALHLFRPRIELPTATTGGPGALRRAVATLVGLAQLATDGSARRLPGSSPRRQYGTARIDLDAVRRHARAHGVRVTDVVLALVAEAVHRTHPELAERSGGTLRVAVTQMVRAPGTGPEGNATAAVMVDLPLDGRPFDERLGEIARHTARLRTPTRAIASRFVMATGLRLLPEPAAGWFARTVYGGRFFHAVVSNMPGPGSPLAMGGAPADEVYPVLPVAPGAPLSVGALSWSGGLGFGLATDPQWLDARVLADGVAAAARVLGGPVDVAGSVGRPDGPGEGEEEASAFAR
jgi:hypothetical protein